MSTEIDKVAPSASNAVQSLAEGKQNVFTTIKGEDFASKMAVLVATTDSEPLAENLNMPITIANFVVQSIEMADEETGEVSEVPRTIIITPEGKAYHAISNGIFKSIENICGILGSDPSKWAAPVVVKAIRGGSGTRQYFTLVPVTK